MKTLENITFFIKGNNVWLQQRSVGWEAQAPAIVASLTKTQ
jgi:hypothetical protein